MADPEARPRERTPDQLAVDIAVRLAILALFAWVVLLLVRPFLPILLWSIVLTVAFEPAHAWLTARLGGRGWLAAAVITVLALAVAIGPATVLVTSAIHSLELLAEWIGAGQHHLPDPPKAVATLPVVGPAIDQAWREASSNLEAFIGRYGRALIGPGEWVLHFIAGLAGSIVAILAAVLVSGFLYVPAPHLVRGLRVVAERVIGHHRGIAFLDLAAATIRNVARGIIGVAILQSLLIGVAFIVVEVPAAGLLSLAVLILAIVQVGAFPIIVPVLVWAWLDARHRHGAAPHRLADPGRPLGHGPEADVHGQGPAGAAARHPCRRDRRHRRLRADRPLPRADRPRRLLRARALLGDGGAGRRRRRARRNRVGQARAGDRPLDPVGEDESRRRPRACARASGSGPRR